MPTMAANQYQISTNINSLKRVFAIEIEKCDKCGGRVKIIASIEDPAVIEKILKHVGLDEESQTRNRSPPSSLFSHST
ncbi:MAG: IS91 family transposase, partial [Planctomycetaceae bacterium]|nr:IS91 family transposase [Planctomycetaceae bacterium]